MIKRKLRKVGKYKGAYIYSRVLQDDSVVYEITAIGCDHVFRPGSWKSEKAAKAAITRMINSLKSSGDNSLHKIL